MSTILKVGAIILAVGAVAALLFFVILPAYRQGTSPPVASSPAPDIILPPPPTATTAAPGAATPGEQSEADVSPPEKEPAEPTPLPDDGPATAPEAKEPPKCERKEFTVRIFSAYEAEPSSLTIHIGDTITFINEDNNLRWPGADPHPTHSSLPLFDALGGISKGQSYSHTFKVEGRYGWHDHILDDPPTLGFITVLPCSP